MRLLVVSSYLPFPLFSGGHIRLFNLLKELSVSHEITLVCEKRSYQGEDDIKKLSKFCEQVITVPRKKQWSIEHILKTAFSTYPFLLIGHTNKEMKNVIVKVLYEKRFDAIHVETFYVYQNIPKTYLPIILVEHNIEYLVYQRYASVAKLYLRPFLTIDVMKIKHWEERFWEKATKLVSVSQKEKNIMNRNNITVVPNGVDIRQFKTKKVSTKLRRKEKKVLFIGDFKWIQNRQALESILKEIWPKIIINAQEKKLTFPLKLWVVGKQIPDYLKALGDETVSFDENAPDETWKIYQLADVLLAPIKVGGGTSYKILESMASGLPVVTTHLGIEGIGAKPAQEVLVGETSDQLSEQVISLLQDNSLYEKIAEHARILIEKKYDWKVITKTLEEVYKSAIL